MQRIVLALCTCVVLAVAGCSSSSTTAVPVVAPATSKAEPKKGASGTEGSIDGKLLVGVWAFPEPKDLPQEKGGGKVMVTLEFMANDKFKRTMTMNGKDTPSEGTYKLEGNTVTVTGKKGDMDVTSVLTIEKLTDTELIISDTRKGPATFIRKND